MPCSGRTKKGGEEGNRRISFLRRWDFFAVLRFLLNEIVLAISGPGITKEEGVFVVWCFWIMVPGRGQVN